MVEFNPSLPTPESAGDSGDRSERKSRRRSKRKAKGAADLGGFIANESLIWQRDATSAETKPKKAAESIAEALKLRDKKDTDTAKSLPASEASKDINDDQHVEAVTETKTEIEVDPAQSLFAETDAESAESDAALAELTPEEARHALDEYVQVRGMEVAAEQIVADPTGAEAAALAADAAMLERVRDKLAADPAASPEVVTEAAYQEVLAELPVVEVSAETPADPVMATETVTEPPTESIEEVDAIPVAATPPPPTPPRPPRVPGLPELPPSSPNIATYASVPGVETSTSSSPNVISIAEASHFARRAETRGLLVGGLVGYFIGRRKGRIKTEKRLLPVQEKLEKQVRSLHDTIAFKETQIRQEAAKRVYQTKELAEIRQQQQREAAPTPNRPRQLPPPPEVPPPFRPDALPAIAPEYKPPTFEMPAHSPALQLTGEVAAATAMMAASVVEQGRTEAKPIQPSNVSIESRELAAERVKHISTQELIMSSETVVIGNERLRDIYESKRISEPGLRRVMTEYARGGDVQRILQQEIQNKELTYERDPRMRKRLAESLSAAGEKAVHAKNAAKPKLAKQADKAKAAGKQIVSHAVSTASRLDDPTNPTQQLLVRTWVVVTVLLAIIAVILLFR